MKNQNGYTLIELIIYVTLFGSFMLLITQMFIKVLDVRTETNIYTPLLREASAVVNRLRIDIANSTAITAPTSLGTSSTTLTITLNGIATSALITNNTLVYQTNSSTNALHTPTIQTTSATFTRRGTALFPSISTMLTFSTLAQISGTPVTYTVQTTFAGR